MSGVTRLHLVRHAEVETRYHRVFGGGRIDMELSPKGHEQARALAGYLRHHPLDVIVASPMKRVQQTLAPLNGHGPKAHVIMADLREVDFGDWTGLNWNEVKERFGISAFDWLEQMEAGKIPNGESGPALRRRVEPCVRKILREHAGRSVAIFCHGGIVRTILAILLELPLSKMASFDVDYASLTQVDIDENGAEVQLLNFTPWRDLK